MKNIKYLFLLILSPYWLSAQWGGFKSLCLGDGEESYFSSIIYHDDRLYILGEDERDGWEGVSFIVMDTTGVILHKYDILEENKLYALRFKNNLIRNREGNFLFMYETYPGNFYNLTCMTPEAEVLWVREYPHSSEYTSLPYELLELDDGYMLAIAANTSVNTIQLELHKVDIEGNTQWIKYHGDFQRGYFPEGILQVDEKIMVSGTHEVILGSSSIDPSSFILEFDLKGDLQREFIDPDDTTSDGNGFYPTSDGGYIMCTNYAADHPTIPNWFSDQGRISRYDEDLNVIWSNFYGWRSFRCALTFLLPLEDGYIIGGSDYSECASVPIFLPDDPCIPVLHPYSAKIDLEGNLIWEQRDTINNHPTLGSGNYIYDAALDPESGSYYMVGRNTSHHTNAQGDTLPYRRDSGVLFKYDHNGCIIPGCRVVSSTEEIPSILPNDIIISPNPVSDRLNIDLSGLEKTSSISYELYSSNGSMVRSGNLDTNSTALDVGALVRGTYYLRLLDIASAIYMNKAFVKI